MERVEASRPLVRPRIFCPRTREPVLLEEFVRAQLKKRSGTVGFQIWGDPGAGKTTAVRFLEQQLRDDYLVTVTDGNAGRDAAVSSSQPGRIVVQNRLPNAGIPALGFNAEDLVNITLAPWQQDDIIEYLLHSGPDACKSVMRRLQSADISRLDRPAQITAMVLDAMVADERLTDPVATLRSLVDQRVPSAENRVRLGELCAQQSLVSPAVLTAASAMPDANPDTVAMLDLLRFEPITRYLIALAVIEGLKRQRSWWQRGEQQATWQHPWSEALLTEICELCDDEILEPLAAIVGSKKARDQQANAASLLARLQTKWKLTDKQPTNLRSARLQGVVWEAVNLSQRDIDDADFTNSRMPVAKVANKQIGGVQFSSADLDGADFGNVKAIRCHFDNSLLNAARFRKAALNRCDFRGAKMRKADLSGARFRACNLTNAILNGADLTKAEIYASTFDGASFRNTTLKGTKLHGCLSVADFRDADFSEALLDACNLEYMRLNAPVFRHAVLADALLSGSVFPEADFCGADLRRTGLADIEWEGADLRHADLRDCTFHLGSSRSGMLYSPFASEGTRTGFYTDSYNEQEYKPIEDIRKANLRGADLRGASLQGVDFYLVDLRDAEYDPKYHDQLVSSGAFLSDE